MALDQAHEQNNKMVKGNGGAIGLMQNPQALCRWMVGEPQLARLVTEFEECREESMHSEFNAGNKKLHHEQSKAFQLRFKNHVEALFELVNERGNPFEEDSQDLLTLTTQDIIHPSSIKIIRHVEDHGKQQYEEFVKERLIQRTTPLHETIPQNQFTLLNILHPKLPAREWQSSRMLKMIVNCFQNCTLGVKIVMET